MPSLLQPRYDSFRFKFPDSFFPDVLKEKYSSILMSGPIIYKDPVEFLNQTVVGINFLGLGNGVIVQEQPGYGDERANSIEGSVNKFGQRARIDMNNFRYPGAESYYRSAKNPLAMLDKQFTVTFNHTLGFWNYFFLFEAFFYQTMRDTESDDKTLTSTFNVYMLDASTGAELSKVSLMTPLIEKIDALDLTYQEPRPQNKTFKVDFRFNNIDYQFYPYSNSSGFTKNS